MKLSSFTIEKTGFSLAIKDLANTTQSTVNCFVRHTISVPQVDYPKGNKQASKQKNTFTLSYQKQTNSPGKHCPLNREKTKL